MKQRMLPMVLGLGLAITGCGYDKLEATSDADAQGHTAPTQATIEANKRVLGELPFDNMEDFEQANRGLIAREDSLQIKAPENAPNDYVWNQDAYKFIQGDSPDSVNPSLWRQAKLNSIHGLFKVTEGVYQLRGYDLSNMTIIEGDTGYILVDPLTSKETASRGMAFVRKHLGDKPVKAIIFTHSHGDHFGGVLGVISEAEKDTVQVIAPEGFMEESTSENMLAGPTMIRRLAYMYGLNLARSERGHVDTGLGKEPGFGTTGILAPTHIISQTPQPMTVDGVEFVFHNAPATEAPAELMFYLPELKAFCGSEVTSRNMHNLYTLRGAKVRDALAWSNAIEKTRTEFNDADIYFASHHWPIWGNEKIQDFLKKQRDTYKFIHDQTLHMAHSGVTPKEIAEKLKMPEALRTNFSNRGYYGTVSHNSKAVYQGYYGWFDGNPANLNPLPPVEAGKQYVELMGGSDALLKNAQGLFDKGNYRFVAEVLSHLVFSDPSNTAARQLLARTYDQLGYQAESGPWRDVYLTGAYELRHNRPEKGFNPAMAKDLLMHAPLEKYFDTLAVRLDGVEAEGEEMILNFTFPDLGVTHVVKIENSVLHHYIGEPLADADATITQDHETFVDIAVELVTPVNAMLDGKLKVDNLLAMRKFKSMTSDPDFTFDIVMP
ncbi:MAG: alkyl sulfatase dimerization domain-containing protein [Bermanella sp.]